MTFLPFNELPVKAQQDGRGRKPIALKYSGSEVSECGYPKKEAPDADINLHCRSYQLQLFARAGFETHFSSCATDAGRTTVDAGAQRPKIHARVRI